MLALNTSLNLPIAMILNISYRRLFCTAVLTSYAQYQVLLIRERGTRKEECFVFQNRHLAQLRALIGQFVLQRSAFWQLRVERRHLVACLK